MNKGVMLLTVILGLVPVHAQAILMLSPPGDWSTNDNSNLDAGDIFDITGISVDSLYYKSNVGSGEEGPYAPVYETSFSNTPTDPADFLITFISGTPIDCPECVLVVKDGNQEPAQYLFNLASWNGTESIQGTGFWPSQGAISNVAIWGGEEDGGTPPSEIPEPALVALFGMGLMGMGLARIRRKRKIS